MKKKLAMLFCTVLAVTSVMAGCAAYPLSRFSFKLRKPIYLLIVAAMSVPIHVTMIPVFQMTIGMGLYDTIWALIPTSVAFTLTQSNENRTLALALWNYQGQYSSNTDMIMPA